MTGGENRKKNFRGGEPTPSSWPNHGAARPPASAAPIRPNAAILHDDLDGLLSSSDSAALRHLLRQNPELAREYRELAAALSLLNTPLDIELPENLSPSVLAAIRAERSLRGRLPAKLEVGLVAVGASAVALAVASSAELFAPKNPIDVAGKVAVGIAQILAALGNAVASLGSSLTYVDSLARLVSALVRAAGTVVVSSAEPIAFISLASVGLAALSAWSILRARKAFALHAGILALLALVVLAGPLPSFAQTSGGKDKDATTKGATTQEKLADEIDRQLDAEPRRTSGAKDTSGAPDSGLWEDYQKYARDRDEDDGRVRAGERVKIGDSVEIDEDERLTGDAVAIGGEAHVHGHVEGDVVAVGGDVVLYEGAVVDGDCVSVGGAVRELGDATVGGETISVDIPLPLDFNFSFGPSLRGSKRIVDFFFQTGWVVAWLGMALLFYALAGRRIEVVSRRVDTEPGQSFLVGLLGVFGTPFALIVTVILLCITIIGILLIPVVFILLFLMILGSFVAVALALGRRLAHARAGADSLPSNRSPYFFIFLGFLALEGLWLFSSLVKVIPALHAVGTLFAVLGVFVGVFATILGFGATLMSRFGTGPRLAPAGPPPPPAYVSGVPMDPWTAFRTPPPPDVSAPPPPPPPVPPARDPWSPPDLPGGQPPGSPPDSGAPADSGGTGDSGGSPDSGQSGDSGTHGN